MESKQCLFCGKEFSKSINQSVASWKSKRKYCSKACMNEDRKKRVVKYCLNCNKPFEVISSRVNAKYCSPKCASTKQPYWLGKKRPDISAKAKVWSIDRFASTRTRKRTEEEKRKLREQRLGVKNTPESNEKRRRTLKETWRLHRDEIVKKRNQGGENHWNWQNGKSFEQYGEDFTNELRLRIFRRDGFRCKECRTNRDLVAHHIDENKHNNSEVNLVTYCRGCHTRLHTASRHKKYTFQSI